MSFVDPRAAATVTVAASSASRKYESSGKGAFASPASTSADDFVQNTLATTVGRYSDATSKYAVQNQSYNTGQMLEDQLKARDADVKAAYQAAQNQTFSIAQQTNAHVKAAGLYSSVTAALQVSLLTVAVCCVALVCHRLKFVSRLAVCVLCGVAALIWLLFLLYEFADAAHRTNWRWDRYSWSSQTTAPAAPSGNCAASA